MVIDPHAHVDAPSIRIEGDVELVGLRGVHVELPEEGSHAPRLAVRWDVRLQKHCLEKCVYNE